MSRARIQPVRRTKGGTLSEQYLLMLCEHSFLSLWSYPHIFRAPGKELTDLLVIFENHILIFSDKDCQFPNTGDIRIDWNRWYRRAIEESAQQIWGAERWIKSYPNRLFLDAQATQRLPIELPNPAQTKFHRIIVARGAYSRCQEVFEGTGSLIVVSNSNIENVPFVVGQPDTSKGFVHVFDDISLDIVLSTLDTITDFVAYVSKKEQLFQSGISVWAAGEEELLGLYLSKTDNNDEHCFFKSSEIQNLNGIAITEGYWERFINSPQRQAQLIENEISYVWDRLIETFNKYLLNGNQYYASHADISEIEKAHCFLARENRTRRRMLGKALIGLMQKTPHNKRGTRVVAPSYEGNPFYVFLLLPRLRGESADKYRLVRRVFLEACCRVVKLDFTTAKDIIGIATETGISEIRSEDLLYLDAGEWTPEDQIEAQELKRELGLFREIREFRSVEYEYPIRTMPNIKIGRNAPCPCGSGKKYKHCCQARK